MPQPREIHVISNTHWDREWLYDFRETRMMLVDFFDRLLGVLEQEPGWASYVLDSQTVPVEDYLEVRPERRAAIERETAAGRLLLGPWYTCPEGFCVNGESLVRNLLYGHRVARAFGGVMKVGHTPFSYGQNSQMPQIYAGFGIDTILFYHGVSHDDTPNEFIFEGADGTQILGSQMSSGARYNFYHNVYRRVRFGSRIDDREYVWEQGGLPFHLCGEDRHMEHHFLLAPKAGYHAEYIEDAVKALRQAELGVATTPYLAFMDGHDSSVADPVVLRIIEEAKKYLAPDTIFHSRLPDLMAKIKAAVKDLPVLKGERRIPKPMGARLHLYSDVLSCRTRMKRAAVLAETLLQRQAEPYAAVAWLLGAEYPATSLDTAWKLLLRSHAHDSIAGTGVDDIERDMLHRLRQVTNISKSVALRALQHLQMQIDNGDGGDKDVFLTIFNPSPFPRTEVVDAYLDLPATGGFNAFSLTDEAGAPVPAQVAWRRPAKAVINHALDATAMMTCERAAVHVLAADVPALGYTTLKLSPTPNAYRGSLVPETNVMENEHLWIRIAGDGSLSVRDKATGAQYDNLHYFEDGGEAGHAWMHIEPAQDSLISTLGGAARISLEEDGPLLARYAVEYEMAIPVALDENLGDPHQRLDGGPNASRRSAERRAMTITSYLTLKKYARALEVRTVFDNTCHNHRLRVLFPTRIMAANCAVESAYDVVDRPIEHGPGSPWATALHPTFPMQRFVDVSDGVRGFAVINEGLREYEVTPGPDRAIAVTLLRAFEIALTTVSKRWERHPEMELSQCPGRHEFRYLILPHAGRWNDGNVPVEAERLAVPLQPAQAGAHPGGLPRKMSFLSVEPAGLLLSALKRGEDGASLVVRVYNPDDAAVYGALTLFHGAASVHLADLEENGIAPAPRDGNRVRFHAGPKKIVTLKIRFCDDTK